MILIVNCCNTNVNIAYANCFKWLLNVYPSEPVCFYKYATFPPIAAAVVAAPAVLAAAGFTAGGIAAGSIASTMMSAAAVANGGGVAAGGVVATLQAAGEPNIWNNQFNNKSDLFKWQIGHTNSFN